MSGGWWCGWHVVKRSSSQSVRGFLFLLWRCSWTTAPSKVHFKSDYRAEKGGGGENSFWFAHVFMWNDVWNVLQQQLRSFLALLQLLEQQAGFEVPDGEKGLEWNPAAVQYGFLGHQRVFTCAASGHRGWIVACSHVHKAPSTTREHYGTTPAFLPLHFLFNTKYIFLTPKEPLCHHPWARTHQRCHPISSYTQMCSEMKRS